MHFLLTRPEEDSHKLGKILSEYGYGVSHAPMMKIEYLNQKKISLDNIQAVLFTSANGIRSFAKNNSTRDIPCYVVGTASAKEAIECGFHTIHSAGGDVNKLAALVIKELKPESGSLLHVCGKDTAGNLSGILQKNNFHVSRKQLYTAKKISVLSPDTISMIASGEITHIPFFSPRTAKIFAPLIRVAKIENHLKKITALCLSPAVFDVISCLKWQKILTSSLPDQHSLFKLINVKLEDNR